MKGYIMVNGIVLVNVERPLLRQVIDGLMIINGVSEVYAVAGEYDLVVMIRVKTYAELSEIVAGKLTRDLNGIIHAKTLISLEAKSKVNLDEVFL